jgi:DNA-binding beta-propeller fold protein YncE
LGPDGNIWLADRCTTEPSSCADSDLAPIFEFSPSGKMLKNFGAGIFIYPHGLWVDKDGYVWVTDARDAKGKGQQIIKFSPDGKS